MADCPESAHSAWAVLEEDGRLRPTEAFRRLLGPLPSRTFRSPAEVAAAAGFQLREGAWQRGEERLSLFVTPLPEGQLLRLSSTKESAHEVHLLRVVAHDLRGPLANIRSYVGLLLGGRSPLEPRVQRSLHVVRRNADKALALVEDTVDSLRLDRNGLPVEPSAVPLWPALDKALERSDDRAEPSPVMRELRVPEALPDVWAEPDRLARVLYAPLEHLSSRGQAGSRLTVEVQPGPASVDIRLLLEPGDAVSSSPFAREQRILQERKLEDAVRLDVARRVAARWGGSLELLEPPQSTARGFLLRLPLPSTAPGQAADSSSHG